MPVGGTTLKLFTSKRCVSARPPALPDTSCSTLKRGQQRLYVHRDVEGDPKPDSLTPSELPEAGEDEMGRLERVSRWWHSSQYLINDFPSWLKITSEAMCQR